MELVLNITDNALLEGMVYGPVCLAMVLSFRLLRFPDITMEGSFLLGAAVAAVFRVHLSCPPGLDVLAGISAGALAGALTVFFNVQLRIDKLLSGVLSAFACYSVSLVLIGGAVSYGDVWTVLSPFESLDRDIRSALPSGLNLHPIRILGLGGVAIALKLMMDVGLRTERGLVLAAVGHNERTVIHCGINPAQYKYFGLAAANALVALSGILVSMKEGGISATRGQGLIIFALSAYVIGERLFGKVARERRRSDSHVRVSSLHLVRFFRGRLSAAELSTAALTGSFIYFLVMQVAFSMQIPPELPRIVMCGYIVLCIGDIGGIRRFLRAHRRSANA